MKRDLDPQLAAILEAVAGGGMFDDGLPVEEMRARFELTAPMMWNPATLPVESVTDRVLDGPGGALAIRVYRASPGTAPAPLLVYFHGGGFTIGSIDTAEAMCRFLAREAGCIVVSVGFRLAPEHPFPAPVDDGAAAVAWVRANAAALGGDPGRVAVGGDASGATYATVCAQLAHNTDGSPLLAPDLTGQPPAYLLAAEYDFLLDEERAYAARLADAGVPVTLRCWPGTVHNFFSMYDHLDIARAAMGEAAAALREGLREPLGARP